MKILGYRRFSNLEQGRGSSLARQRDLISAFSARKGWAVSEWLSDEGRSAWTGDNLRDGNLGKLVTQLEQGGGEGIGIVVEKLDRLSRQPPLVMASWLQRVCATGAIVMTADDRHIITADDLLRNQMQVLGVIFEAFRGFDESQTKSIRITEAWRLKRKAGAAMTALCPGWLKLRADRSGYDVIEERAAVVRRIFNDTDMGLGKQTIARTLNAEGIPVFGRGNGWHASYVQKITRNPAVLGDYQPHRKSKADARRIPDGDVLRGYFPAIIAEDQFARVNDKRQVAILAQQGTGRRLSNLFTGIASCAECSSIMTLRDKGMAARASGIPVRESYLVCDNAIRARGCTNKVHFNYIDLERGVLDRLLHLALDDHFFTEPDVTGKIEVKLASRRRERADVERRLTNTWIMLEEDPDDELARQRYRALKAQTATLNVQIQSAEEELIDARGAVSPSEHLRRVQEVRGLLESTDEELRYQARSSVKLAMNDIVERLKFDGVRGQVLLTVVGGLRLLVLGRRGEIVLDADLHKPGRQVRRDDPIEQGTIDAYLRRLGVDSVEAAKGLGSP
jgi:DNA invertase Pin-like site-specific DNA recombinase